MAVNVRGSFLAAKHAIPALKQSPVGAVMFVASDAALVAFEGMSPYCSSKGAVVMLAKSLSSDFPSVRFNCLCPGVVDTPMSRADLGFPDGFADTDLPVIEADQLAKQAAFLVSPVSYPINGTTVVSDFGYLARSALPALEFVTERGASTEAIHLTSFHQWPDPSEWEVRPRSHRRVDYGDSAGHGAVRHR